MLGFAPRWQADDFKAFFTSAEGWGTLRQSRDKQSQTNSIVVKHGSLRLRKLAFEVPAVKAVRATLALSGENKSARVTQKAQRVQIALDDQLVVGPGQALDVQLSW